MFLLFLHLSVLRRRLNMHEAGATTIACKIYEIIETAPLNIALKLMRRSTLSTRQD